MCNNDSSSEHPRVPPELLVEKQSLAQSPWKFTEVTLGMSSEAGVTLGTAEPKALCVGAPKQAPSMCSGHSLRCLHPPRALQDTLQDFPGAEATELGRSHSTWEVPAAALLSPSAADRTRDGPAGIPWALGLLLPFTGTCAQ